MCSNPLQFDEVQTACRKCNECLSAKINGWTSRAVAESKCHKHTMAIGLTYANDTQQNKDGSKLFHYQHVQAFLKRVRAQLQDRYNIQDIRYLCCGENGSKRGRVHWHMVLFTSQDITSLGKWTTFDKGNPDKFIHQTEFKGKIDITDQPAYHKQDRRMSWSLWPHGHVMIQEADEIGIAYCLKYAFKDQFNVQNSKDTMRYAKSEIHSSSMFRMSKQPPIGFMWIERKLKKLEQTLSVLTTLDLKINDTTNYWHPTGALRDYLIDGLYSINQQSIETNGRPSPQFDTLLNTLLSVNKQKDFERLYYGEVQEQTWQDHLWQDEFKAQALRNKADSGVYVQKYCRSTKACDTCIKSFDPFTVRAYAKYTRDIDRLTADQLTEHKSKNKQNPYCAFKDPQKVADYESKIIGA